MQTKTSTMPSTPHSLLLEAQARFEVEAFDEGISRYREALQARDLTELTMGQRLLREIVPALAERIKAAQDEAEAGLAHRGRLPLWAWPIGLVEAERLAVITLGTVLSFGRVAPDIEGHYRLTENSHPLVFAARRVAAAARIQVEYDNWSSDAEPAVLKRLERRYPHVNRNVWTRWRRKVDAARETWEPAIETALGCHLIALLAEAAPTRFSITHIIQRGKTVAHLQVTEETLALIDDLATRAEIARPVLMPMICPPIPWRYE